MKNRLLLFTILLTLVSAPAFSMESKKYSPKEIAENTIMKEDLLTYPDGDAVHEISLLDRTTSNTWGYITFFVPKEEAIVKLNTLKVVGKEHYRKGIGRYLFNAMLEKLYALNKQHAGQQGRLLFTKIEFIAAPQDINIGLDNESIQRYRTEKAARLPGLILFYESVGCKVDSCGTDTAYMHFDLVKFYLKKYFL